MRKIFPLLVIGLSCVAFYPHPAEALVMSAPKPKFAYKDASGKKQSVEIVDKYQSKKIVQPLAKIDSTIDPKLCRAATIAQERANAHSHSLCWRFVKEALVAAGVVRSRPTGRSPDFVRPTCPRWHHHGCGSAGAIRLIRSRNPLTGCLVLR